MPGGPHLEKMAASGDSKKYTLPRPLVNSKDENLRKGCDFSFSGLKTSTRMLVQRELNDQLVRCVLCVGALCAVCWCAVCCVSVRCVRCGACSETTEKCVCSPQMSGSS